MRFLTFNLWHGLTPMTPVVFDALESVGRRRLREERQIEVLRQCKPDIVFLQEVNPVTRRAELFKRELKMNHVLQPDLVGLKLFGVGLPLNLNSGLLTLAERKLNLKKLQGLSLSRPGTHLVQTWASWQLSEERFALFSEAMIPHLGRVLLVNTHLHHGLESTPEFEAEILQMAEDMDLPEPAISELQSRLQAGTQRRLKEIEVLLAAVEKMGHRHQVVVMGGDFNCSPQGPEAARIRQAGFRDAWAEAHPDQAGMTYDGTVNVANHLLQSRFPLTLVVEDLSFDRRTKEALLGLARAQESRPRRIDYLWVKSHELNMQVRHAECVGRPDSEGFAPSDHFGVYVDLEVV